MNEKLYLHEDWMPIATAPKDGEIGVCFGTLE